jgi:xylulokinase
LLGADGLPLRNAVLWNDNRCAREVRELERESWSAAPVDHPQSLNTMCSCRSFCGSRKRARILGENGSVPLSKRLYRLPAYRRERHDHSDASGSSFYDIRTQAWSVDIMELFGIEGGKTAAVEAIDRHSGIVNAAASEQTGVPAGIPVAAGGSDAVTELLAAGIGSSSQCKVRLGTSGALSTVVDSIDGRSGGFISGFC